MGVNLTPIVSRTRVSLDAFRGRTLAVDGNLELYQFLSIMRMRDGSPLRDRRGRVTSHLNGLVFRMTRLIADHGIRLTIVFDGPPPALKRRELEARRATRDRAAADYDRALRAGDLGTAWSKAVTATRLTPAMVGEAKELLFLLGIPVLQAPSEGEAQAAHLVRSGAAWAVSSKDYDALLFGAPRLARFVAVGSREFLPSLGISRVVPPELIELETWLHDLALTRPQLIDVAILLGTDFNDGVPRVGPKTALRLLRAHGSLEDLPGEIRDALPANVDEIRAFFLNPPAVEADRAVAGKFDPDGVFRFLCDDRDFSRVRVETAVRRLDAAEKKTVRLDDFMGGPETVK